MFRLAPPSAVCAASDDEASGSRAAGTRGTEARRSGPRRAGQGQRGSDDPGEEERRMKWTGRRLESRTRAVRNRVLSLHSSQAKLHKMGSNWFRDFRIPSVTLVSINNL